MAKMADADLRELVKRRRDASAKYLNDNHSRDRKEALSFYRGENDTVYGDSGDGLSTVVSRDTYEAIESILPGLIKPFVAGEEAVSFDPRGPEDEEGAKQATEYINYRFTNDNSAFRVVYDYAKDGLLYRLGVAKVVHEEVEETTVDTYADLSDEEFAALESLIADVEGAEILDDPERDENGITARVKMSGTRPTYRVHIVAPEEFLHEDRLASLEDATFLAHRKNVAVGDLIAMGLPKNKCMKLQGLEPETGEADQRHGFDEFREQFDDNDLARQVTVTDAYVRCDYDGSGTLQWRRVILGGTEDTLLHEEPVEDHPFVPWTPIPIPHKLVGLSIHDATRDIQMQATAVSREMLNALYLANRPQREVVEGQVNIEDLLTPTVGGMVRVKQPGQVREIPAGGDGVIQQSMAMLEHLATIREQRTGSTRYNQGMDANSLNKTATGISIIQNASTQRLEVIARQLAEAMEQIFKKDARAGHSARRPQGGHPAPRRMGRNGSAQLQRIRHDRLGRPRHRQQGADGCAPDEPDEYSEGNRLGAGQSQRPDRQVGKHLRSGQAPDREPRAEGRRALLQRPEERAAGGGQNRGPAGAARPEQRPDRGQGAH
jgi:hypothetical protein